MKFKFKKLILILSMSIILGSLVACSNNKEEENKNNTLESNQQVDNIKNEDESQIDNDESQTDNNTDEKTEVVNTISEDEALKICKEKLTGICKSDFLKVGTDNSEENKIINFDDKKYYAIYYIDDENDVMADFRFLVDESSGELFYQSPEDLKRLVPIDEYVSKLKNNNSDLLNDISNNKNE